MIIGFLGGGQLARMMALCGYSLGYQFKAFDPSPKPCANDLMPCVQAPYDDKSAMDSFLQNVDVISYENENIPIQMAKHIASQRPFYPSIPLLEISQDRLLEKTYFQSRNIPTAAFMAIDTMEDLNSAYQAADQGIILKTRRFGYDGKGQFRILTPEQLSKFEPHLKPKHWISEAFVSFDFEVSLVSARDTHGQVFHYPLTKNTHKDGILRESFAPFLDAKLQLKAQHIMEGILQENDYVGVCTIEFFVLGNELLVNELAPRVHNSGHWTLNGANCSQFEAHIRAISGLRLAPFECMKNNYMYNCIGRMPKLESLSHLPSVHYHDYRKSAKPNRKLGHINLSNNKDEQFEMDKMQLSLLIEA